MTTSALCAACHAPIPLPAPERCPSCHAVVRLDGRYLLLGALGHGAVGTTYRAETPEGDIVAIKELLVRRLDAFKTQTLFEREAAVLASIHHPGVPRFFEHFSAGEGRQIGHYLVTEFIDGPTLAEEVKRKRPSEDDVIAVLRELAAILADLHALRPPVVHRDIKPGNLMRDRSGQLKLIDFGAVKDVAREADGGGSTVAGTFGYMAPEQFAGIAEPSSDLYAVGVVAVELLTGNPPSALLDDQNRLAWEDAVSGISPGLRHVLGRLLATARQDRLQNGAELVAMLDDLVAGALAVPASPSSYTEPPPWEFQPPSVGEALGEALDAVKGGRLEDVARALSALRRAPGAPPKPLGPPPPSAPRPYPTSLVKRAAPGASVKIWFGLVLALIGTTAFLSTLTGAEWVDRITRQQMSPGLPLLFGLVFSIPGYLFSLWGVRRRRQLRSIWRDGHAALARITDLDRDQSISINGRHPWRFHLEFEVDGLRVSGEVSGWNREGYNPGDQAHVLYDPASPKHCILYPLPDA